MQMGLYCQLMVEKEREILIKDKDNKGKDNKGKDKDNINKWDSFNQWKSWLYVWTTINNNNYNNNISR